MERRKKRLLLGSFLIPLLSIANGFPLQSPQCVPSKHFVLVHGSCHGAWSWYKIVAQLSSSRHYVTAIDLAASGIDPRQAKTLKSVSEYHRPLMEFMESLPPHEKAILVGHSLGGLAISQAMERFPSKISVAVFATALMPGPQLNISTLNKESFSRTGSLLDTYYTYDDGPNNPPTTFVFGPMYLSSKVYQLSPFEDWVLATMLVRPLRLFSEDDLSKQLMLTTQNYGSVNRIFIISEEDEVMKKDFQQWMIERNPPNEVIEMLGSDHMLMMSKPRQLLGHLVSMARNY